MKKAKKQKQSKGKPIEKGFVDVLKDQGCHIWVHQRTDGAQDETYFACVTIITLPGNQHAKVETKQ